MPSYGPCSLLPFVLSYGVVVGVVAFVFSLDRVMIKQRKYDTTGWLRRLGGYVGVAVYQKSLLILRKSRKLITDLEEGIL